MRTFIMLVCLTLATLFGAVRVEAGAAVPSMPPIEKILVLDAGSTLTQVDVAGPVTLTKGGTVGKCVVVGEFLNGLPADGKMTVTYVKPAPAKGKRAARPEAWKIVISGNNTVKAGGGQFSLAFTFDPVTRACNGSTLKALVHPAKKMSVKNGCNLQVVLADATPAWLEKSFLTSLPIPAEASMGQARSARFLPGREKILVAGRAFFPNDTGVFKVRPCAWLVDVSSTPFTTTFFPLWADGVGTEGEAYCVGTIDGTFYVGGWLRTTNAVPDAVGVPIVWAFDGSSFGSPREILDDSPQTYDFGYIAAIEGNRLFGDMNGFASVCKLNELPVHLREGQIVAASRSGSQQIGNEGATVVRFSGTSSSSLPNANFALGLGCSPSGNCGSGWASRDRQASLWNTKGQLAFLTEQKQPFTGATWLVGDGGAAYGTGFDVSDPGLIGWGEHQEQPSWAFYRPAGKSTEIQRFAALASSLTWLDGYDASTTTPEGFLGGDTAAADGALVVGFDAQEMPILLWHAR